MAMSTLSTKNSISLGELKYNLMIEAADALEQLFAADVTHIENENTDTYELCLKFHKMADALKKKYDF